MTEHEYMRKWAEQNDSAIKSDVHTLFKERDAALADYRALERQYTDLNRLWMAKSKEADALRSELQHATDSAKWVARAFENDPPLLSDNQADALQNLTRSLDHARTLLSKGGV